MQYEFNPHATTFDGYYACPFCGRLNHSIETHYEGCTTASHYYFTEGELRYFDNVVGVYGYCNPSGIAQHLYHHFLGDALTRDQVTPEQVWMTTQSHLQAIAASPGKRALVECELQNFLELVEGVQTEVCYA